MFLEIYDIYPSTFLSAPELAQQVAFKKTKVIGISRSLYRYTKANNKYIKDYDKNKKLPYVQYWDVNNIYRWAVSQKLPLNNFEKIKDTSQFNEDFTKNYNEKRGQRYFLKVNAQYTENQMNLKMIYIFTRNNKNGKSRNWLIIGMIKLTEYVIHIRNLTKALDHGLGFKKFHKVIKFNQNVSLNPHIDIDTDLKKSKK